MKNVVDELLQPNFEQKPNPRDKRSRSERDDAAAIKTYRYLRLGMVLIVVALTAALWHQWRSAGCAQGSISAYYYEPVGPLFVGGMVAIGVSLIVIMGATIVEDILLNVAGMLAPIVAFVPTTQEPACVPGRRPPPPSEILSTDVLARVNNNVWALLVAGTAALLVGVFLFFKEQGEDKVAPATNARLMALGFHGATVAVGWSLYASGTIVRVHGKAAVAMFVALGLAALASGRSLQLIKKPDDKPPHWVLYKNVYYSIAALMAAFGLAVGLGQAPGITAPSSSNWARSDCSWRCGWSNRSSGGAG